MTKTPFTEGEPGADLLSNIRYLGKQRKLLGKRTDASWILFPVFTSTSRLHMAGSPGPWQFVHRRRARIPQIVRTMGSRRCANETSAANRSHNSGPGPFRPKTPVVRTIWRSGIVRTMDPMVVRTIYAAEIVRTMGPACCANDFPSKIRLHDPCASGPCRIAIAIVRLARPVGGAVDFARLRLPRSSSHALEGTKGSSDLSLTIENRAPIRAKSSLPDRRRT